MVRFTFPICEHRLSLLITGRSPIRRSAAHLLRVKCSGVPRFPPSWRIVAVIPACAELSQSVRLREESEKTCRQQELKARLGLKLRRSRLLLKTAGFLEKVSSVWQWAKTLQPWSSCKKKKKKTLDCTHSVMVRFTCRKKKSPKYVLNTFKKYISLCKRIKLVY